MNPQDRDEYLLSQYLDGQLPEDDRRELEKRLRQEPQLADLLDQLRKTDRLVRDAAGPAPQLNWDRFTEQVTVRRQAHDATQRRNRILRIYIPLAAAAAIALVTTLSLTFNRTDRFAQGPSPIDTVPGQQDDTTAIPGQAFASVVRVSLVRPTGLEIIDAAPDQRPLPGMALAAAGITQSVTELTEASPYF